MKIVYNQDGITIEQHEAGNANELHKKYFPLSEDVMYEESCRAIAIIGRKGGFALYYLVALDKGQNELTEDRLNESVNILKRRLKDK